MLSEKKMVIGYFKFIFYGKILFFFEILFSKL